MNWQGIETFYRSKFPGVIFVKNKFSLFKADATCITEGFWTVGTCTPQRGFRVVAMNAAKPVMISRFSHRHH